MKLHVQNLPGLSWTCPDITASYVLQTWPIKWETYIMGICSSSPQFDIMRITYLKCKVANILIVINTDNSHIMADSIW